MPHPVLGAGKTALITGAASGVGFGVAKLVASHGMNVALVDINAEGLTAARKALNSTATGNTIEAYTVDVSRIEQWADLKVKVDEKFGEIHLLMLNAGVGGKGEWEDGAYFRRVSSSFLYLFEEFV